MQSSLMLRNFYRNSSPSISSKAPRNSSVSFRTRLPGFPFLPNGLKQRRKANHCAATRNSFAPPICNSPPAPKPTTTPAPPPMPPAAAEAARLAAEQDQLREKSGADSAKTQAAAAQQIEKLRHDREASRAADHRAELARELSQANDVAER